MVFPIKAEPYERDRPLRSFFPHEFTVDPRSHADHGNRSSIASTGVGDEFHVDLGMDILSGLTTTIAALMGESGSFLLCLT